MKIAIALPLGHLFACFSDAFTKQGVQLFWPQPAWAISVSNPNRRLTTGGTGEYWVLATATAVLVLGIWLAGGGGATQKVGSSLGLADAQIKNYNQLAANHLVWANIRGVKQSDRATVENRYLVVGEDSGFIVMSSEKELYKVGDGLIADRLVINQGQTANIQLSSIAFDDENLATRLSQVREQYPGSLILVNGTVSVDFPEDITLSQQPDQLNTIKLSGTNVTLTYCPISEAIMRPYMPLDGQLVGLQFQLLRAARAFLDPELQMGKITPEEALQVLKEDVVFSDAFSKEEVERYTFRAPGQATSYFYGYTRLLALRKKTEQALGAKFDQQKFHDFILVQGLLPPALLRKTVLQEFISEKD